jgi:hypothetical protein
MDFIKCFLEIMYWEGDCSKLHYIILSILIKEKVTGALDISFITMNNLYLMCLSSIIL